MPSPAWSSPSLDEGWAVVEDGGTPFIGKQNSPVDHDEVRTACQQAKDSKCSRAIRREFVYSDGTKRAFQIACGTWACPWCGWRKQTVATFVVQEGIKQALERGDRVRFMTLTEDPKRPLDIAGLYKAWNRFRIKLKRQGKLKEYAAVVERTKRGRLHLHIVATGDYIKQSQLSQLAEEAGFGRVADIRAVKEEAGDEKKTAGYIAKELAGYVAKAKGAEVETGKNRRPLRTSRSWYPGGMARAAEEIAVAAFEKRGEERDLGPWWYVKGDPDGAALKVRGQDSEGTNWALILGNFGAEEVCSSVEQASGRQQSAA